MADNIINYLLEDGKKSLSERTFCEVDALILTQICYLKFDGFVGGPADNQDFIPLRDIMKEESVDKLFVDHRYEKSNRELMKAITECERFRDLSVNAYISIQELENEAQFSAILFRLPNGEYFVCFRGTDEYMVGWKEDFNMFFMKEVPAQYYAVRYLNAIKKYLKEPFYIGGHSKGGNLAVYASMNADEEMQQKIKTIYSMDGPGFLKEVLEECHFEVIKPKLQKYIPQQSLFGMLMQWDDYYSVIHSTGFGISQHSPFAWEIENCGFIPVKELEGGAVLVDRTINEWVMRLDMDSRKSFVETLYSIVQACDADEMNGLQANAWKNMNQALNASKNLDEETANMLRRIMKILFDQGKNNLKAEFELEKNRRKQELHDLSGKASEAMKELPGKASEAMKELPGKASEAMKELPGKASEAMKELPGKASEAMKELPGKASEAMKELPGKAGEAMKELPEKMNEVVRQVQERKKDEKKNMNAE